MTTPIDQAALDAALKSVGEDLAQHLKKHTDEVEKYGKAATDLTGQIDELSGKYKELQDELADMAQKQFPASPEHQAPVSAGNEFIKSEQFQALAKRQIERARIEVKNTVVADGTTTFPMQRPGVTPGDFAPLTIRQLIPTITVAENAVNSLREATNVNNAAEVAQGGAKPESDITFEQYNVPVETVAHWIKVSNQLMADAPAVAAYIDTRLRDGLAQRVDAQLLNGNGSTPNLSGLTNAGNFTAFTPTSGANLVESINKAKYALWATGNMPDTVIVNPADWGAMELAREGAGTGAYLYGAPGTNAGTSPFGVQVVMSNNMAAGSFLIGSMRASATIYQRQGAVVEMGFINDDFTKNLVTIRAEERLALAVDRPSGIMFGDITAA
ncbi:phage major capsid protein [Marinobacter sp. NSM]|uniref:phage major capsid protein n=1 Tax=Marinobacter sp. NSM TaxID=3458004 RepID=UPI0040373BBC